MSVEEAKEMLGPTLAYLLEVLLYSFCLPREGHGVIICMYVK